MGHSERAGEDTTDGGASCTLIAQDTSGAIGLLCGPNLTDALNRESPGRQREVANLAGAFPKVTTRCERSHPLAIWSYRHVSGCELVGDMSLANTKTASVLWAHSRGRKYIDVLLSSVYQLTTQPIGRTRCVRSGGLGLWSSLGW